MSPLTRMTRASAAWLAEPTISPRCMEMELSWVFFRYRRLTAYLERTTSLVCRNMTAALLLCFLFLVVVVAFAKGHKMGRKNMKPSQCGRNYRRRCSKLHQKKSCLFSTTSAAPSAYRASWPRTRWRRCGALA